MAAVAGASWAVLAAVATLVVAGAIMALARTEGLETRVVRVVMEEAKAAVVKAEVLEVALAAEVDSGDESHSRESNRLTIQLGR